MTLAYPLYHAHDPLCCPSGGSATVNFQLNNGQLTPLQSIPPELPGRPQPPVAARPGGDRRGV